jgi:hypothetical protein
MEELEQKKKRRKKAFILLILLFTGSILILFFQQRSFNEEEEMYKNSLGDLQSEMKIMKNQIHELKLNNKSLDHKKDSLQKNLSFLWKYKTLVQTARLRDQIGEDLSFESGERVRMKADSSIVVITDIIVGGNTYNYYIKYLVKTHKGLILDVSPFEIETLR